MVVAALGGCGKLWLVVPSSKGVILAAIGGLVELQNNPIMALPIVLEPLRQFRKMRCLLMLLM